MALMAKEEFVELLRKADNAGYIMVTALLCVGVGKDGVDIVSSYDAADFEEAVKRLEADQVYTPQYAEYYATAIDHIRRIWLHREATA